MDTSGLFTAALGLQAPWTVSDVRFDPQASEIHFDVSCGAPRLPCPVCEAADQPIHDRKKRSWQHLHFFQHRAYIHAELPRVACGGCGKTTQVPVPWARPGSGFTLLFEAYALMLAKSMPMRQAAGLLGVGDTRLWRALVPIIEQARAQQSHARVRRIGVDEKYLGRLGYISLFHDADMRCTLFGVQGRDESSVASFVADLQAHEGDPERIEAVAMDMSKAYQAGARKSLPEATICFDAFHLIKLANEALDQVRRQEVKGQQELRGIRWGLLKDAADWTPKQMNQMHWLQRSRLKSARAWRLKEALRDIVAQGSESLRLDTLLDRWISWARRSRLEPFKRLGATVRTHRHGILASFRLGMSNATAESINSRIQMAIARARGFRTFRQMMAIVYLTTGKLAHLPAPPLRHLQAA